MVLGKFCDLSPNWNWKHIGWSFCLYWIFFPILLTIPSPIVVYARSYVPYARSYSDAFLVYRALYQFVAGYKIQWKSWSHN